MIARFARGALGIRAGCRYHGAAMSRGHLGGSDAASSSGAAARRGASSPAAPAWLVFAAVLALPGCAASPGAASPRTRAPDAAAIEREVVAQVNRHRRAAGLEPLAVDAAIGRQARLHSAAMASRAIPPGHDGFDDRVAALRRTLGCRRAAENVAMNRGYDAPATEAVRGWLRSRGHRENIEGPYRATGVGVASDGAGNTYFTQIFVAP